jgi:ubiquitin carboxyl-terminal hydrolase 15
VSSLPDTVTGSTICSLFLKVMTPFRVSKNDISEADQTIGNSSLYNESESVGESNLDNESASVNMNSNASELTSKNNNSLEDESEIEDVLQFFQINEKFPDQRSNIEMDEPVTLKGSQKRLHVVVCCQDSGLEQYNLVSFDSLPEIYKAVLFSRRPQDTCSLYACLEAFIKEEPLGPDDMW